MRFTKAEIFDSKRGGMSPKRSRLACARLVPRLITSWRAVHRPRCSRSPSPRRASRPSRAPGPSTRGARAARRWPAGTSGAPAATGSRCARAARARRGRSAPPPRKVRGDWVRSAAPSSSRVERATERREERWSFSTREPRPAARRATTASIHFHRASQSRRGRFRRVGTFSGSMTSHFFDDGFFFSENQILFFHRGTNATRARARANHLERD